MTSNEEVTDAGRAFREEIEIRTDELERPLLDALGDDVDELLDHLLIGSVAFELIDEALKIAEVGRVGLFMLIGAATFTVGNWYLDHKGAADRKDSSGAQEDGSRLAIVFGSILDGIPESFVLGLTVLEGGVSVGLLMGVMLSNLPEGMSSSAGLRIAGWPRGRVFGMWIAVAVVAGLSAALGYQLLGDASGHSGAFAQGFAAGALLAMVADTMLPEAYETEQGFTGSLVAVGFAVSLILSSLEPVPIAFTQGE